MRVHAAVGEFDAGVAVGGVFKLEDDVGVVPLGVLEQVAGGLDAPDEAVALLGFGDVELGELVVVLEVELAAGGVGGALDGFVPPLLWPGDGAEDFGAARRDLEGGGEVFDGAEFGAVGELVVGHGAVGVVDGDVETLVADLLDAFFNQQAPGLVEGGHVGDVEHQAVAGEAVFAEVVEDFLGSGEVDHALELHDGLRFSTIHRPDPRRRVVVGAHQVEAEGFGKLAEDLHAADRVALLVQARAE